MLINSKSVGTAYYTNRAELMIARNESMTKTYNRFHDVNETSTDIVRLRELHAEMDRAVHRAYGWDDLADRAQPEFLAEETEDAVYESLLDLARTTKKKIADMSPRDIIDIQSFMWTAVEYTEEDKADYQ